MLVSTVYYKNALEAGCKIKKAVTVWLLTGQ
jgi:hypothetical protein